MEAATCLDDVKYIFLFPVIANKRMLFQCNQVEAQTLSLVLEIIS
jgi:hypothetical protein